MPGIKMMHIVTFTVVCIANALMGENVHVTSVLAMGGTFNGEGNGRRK